VRIHLESDEQVNLIRSYGPGRIVIHETGYASSLIVLANRIITDWLPQHVADLSPEHMHRLASLECEVLLLGTGQRLRFPDPSALAPLARTGIGLEVMDTGAACRTYNILLSEGRPVAAALLPIGSD